MLITIAYPLHFGEADCNDFGNIRVRFRIYSSGLQGEGSRIFSVKSRNPQRCRDDSSALRTKH